MLAVYELNRTELLRDLFVWAYKRSCARFIEIAETQLMALHEGNIARYRLRPSEYRAWREHWA